MERIRKHLAIPLLLAALLVVGLVFTKAYAWKDSGTFYLKDLEGERSALEDVTITGDLKDGYHRTSFTIRGGQVETLTEVFNKPEEANPRKYVPGASKVMDGIAYEVRGNGRFEIVYTDRRNKKYVQSGSAQVNIQVANPFALGTTFTNPLEYGLAKIGDKVYFTVPTTKYYTGTNGIYEITQFSEHIPYSKEQQIRTLTTFQLNPKPTMDNSPEDIEVLGLEAVGDKLALIAVEADKLVIRVYDSNSGQLLGEAKVDDFRIAGGARVKTPQAEGHYETYEAYSDKETRVLTLSFRSSASTADESRRTIVSVDLSSGVKLLDVVKGSYTDGVTDNYNGVTYMNHKNGKLYVAMNVVENVEISSKAFDITRPKRFILYVYQASELIYKGELITDVNDDNLAAEAKSTVSSGGFRYDPSEYRNFADIRIE